MTTTRYVIHDDNVRPYDPFLDPDDAPTYALTCTGTFRRNTYTPVTVEDSDVAMGLTYITNADGSNAGWAPAAAIVVFTPDPYADPLDVAALAID